MDMRRIPFQCYRVQIHTADDQRSGSSWNCRGPQRSQGCASEVQLRRPPTPLTSFRRLELLRGAGRPLPPAVVDPDVDQVEAEGVEAGQHATGVVPTEVEDVLLRVVAVVPVQAALPPVVHLPRGDVGAFRLMKKKKARRHSRWSFCTLNPLRWPRSNFEGTGSQCISATVLLSTMA